MSGAVQRPDFVHPVGVPLITAPTASSAPARLADGFDGTPIHARGFALAAVYKTPSQPAADGDWVEHGYISNAWTHPAFPRHVVWKPADDVVVVTQLAQSTPKEAVALKVARAALGPSAVPEYVVSYPLCVRLSMTAGTDLRLELPQGPYRCRRLWPTREADAHVEVLDGVKVELRVSGTSVGRSTRFYAEAFVGRAHVNKKSEPRSIIFGADARHVLLAPDPQQLQRFTARLMDRPFTFAVVREDDGLAIDGRRLAGRRLGLVRACQHVDDFEFAIRLPQPQGTMKFVGSWFSP